MNSSLSIHSFAEYVEQFTTLLIDYSPKLISALIILFIGLYVIRFINRLVRKIMVKREFDPTLSKFLADSLLWALRILLFVSFYFQIRHRNFFICGNSRCGWFGDWFVTSRLFVQFCRRNVDYFIQTFQSWRHH